MHQVSCIVKWVNDIAIGNYDTRIGIGKNSRNYRNFGLNDSTIQIACMADITIVFFCLVCHFLNNYLANFVIWMPYNIMFFQRKVDLIFNSQFALVENL